MTAALVGLGCGGMKATLFAMFVALLMAGCCTTQPGGDSLESNCTSAVIPPEIVGDEITIKTIKVSAIDLDK